MLKLVKKHIVILGISLSITMVACPVVSEARTTAENNKQESFINEIAPYAKKVQHEHHILSSIIISQAILESNWGTSKLAKQGKNLFGIKGAFKGNAIYLPTKEFRNGNWIATNASFCVYPSWYESLSSHGELLGKGPSWNRNLYKGLVNEKNYKKAAAIIGKSGYSSDPDYTEKLISLIEKFKLQQYDNDLAAEKQSRKNLVDFAGIFPRKSMLTTVQSDTQFAQAAKLGLTISSPLRFGRNFAGRTQVTYKVTHPFQSSANLLVDASITNGMILR